MITITYLPPPPEIIAQSLVFEMPDTPEEFNNKVQGTVKDELIKYCSALAGILAFRMLMTPR